MKFTLMRHQLVGSVPAPGKSYIWMGGHVEKDVEGSYTHLLAETVETDLKGLAKLIRSIDCNSHFVAGVSHAACSVDVVPTGAAIEGKVSISRTNESFPFAVGEAGLMVIDSDGLGGPEVWQQIISAAPGLQQCNPARVEASSSSSNLYAPDGCTQLSGEKGQHTYLHVADAADIPRALTVLHRRLILSGFARYKLSATGDILERSAVDQQLRVSSQPIYIHPTLHGGITQKKRVEFFKGEEVIDTHIAIPDLTPEEEAAYRQADAAARAALKGDAEAAAAEYDEERGKALPGGAAEARAARQGNRLPSAWKIVLSNGEEVTVGAILADPKKYHGRTCRDPLEPEYGGKTVAKIYSDQDTPMINSWAHGGRSFHLGEIDLSMFKAASEQEEGPRDIIKEYLRLPFPLAALPALLAAACMDVQYDVQAPMPLVVGSALASLSTACMGHVDAWRSATLIGPCGLYITSVAGSSERKSTTDRRFSKAIRDHDAAAILNFNRTFAIYKDRLALWEVQVAAMDKSYADAIKGRVPDADGNYPDIPENDMMSPKQIMQQILAWKARNPKPAPPACPRLMLDNVTVEKVYQHLGRYPLVAILSDEGGTFTGSRAMNSESMMATTALLNKVHGGDLIVKDTKGDDDRCPAPRGSMHLMLQPGIFANMLNVGGGQARDIGFISRHLICEPESTKGSRLLTGRQEAGTFGIDLFNQRIAEMLRVPILTDPITGALITKVLPPSQEAHSVWVEYHDKVERQVGADGAYAGIDDIAGKNADNAMRLAVCFARLAQEDVVSVDTMRGACAVAEWYLNETLVLFGLKAESEVVRDAVAIESWIVKQCVDGKKEFVTYNDVAQNITTRGLRKKPGEPRRSAALRYLFDLRRLKYEPHGKSVRVFPLPDLLVDVRVKCFG